MEKPLRILSASAGSGKTFNLAQTYIRLLLSNPDPRAYRGILAVTFTNASTDDMKKKILESLRTLALSPEKSPYRKIFVPLVFKSDTELQRKAGTVLDNILHDYGAFAVSTIDSFFQTAIHAFSREIGQFASYQVELDKDSLVGESVDRVLENLGNDKVLLKWLQDNVIDAAQSGKGYNLDAKLQGMSKSLLSEEHSRLMDQIAGDGNSSSEVEDKIYREDNLERVRKLLKTYRSGFVSEVQSAADGMLKALESNGIEPEDTSRGWLKAIRNYAGNEYREFVSREPRQWQRTVPTNAFLGHGEDFAAWWKKSDVGNFAGYEGALMGPYRAFTDLFTGSKYKLYCTAGLILGSLGELVISSRLRTAFQTLMKEKNVLSIDDSNTFLRKIIDGSDAPFVYEKIGVRYRHYLMDEFQDTSRVQWDCFRPLIENSLAGGPDDEPEDLLVGDVKQSIYRWRGADWQLMQKQVPEEFASGVTIEKPLEGNYRSLRNVVGFNNEFFRYAADWRDKEYSSSTKTQSSYISEIYGFLAEGEDAGFQKPMQTKDPAAGHIKAVFCNKDMELSQVLEAISRARSRHARYEDIAVLVRKRDDGAAVAAMLAEHNIPVISDDSLSLKNSAVVKVLTALLCRWQNPCDKIKSWFAQGYDISEDKFRGESLPEVCDSLLAEIKKKIPEKFRMESQYVQAFMDALRDWTSKNGNDLPAFLEWWESEDPKLSSPSGADAVRVITIHKSKGLEFPCVIFPFVEEVQYKKNNLYSWCCADFGDTDLSDAGPLPVNVNLTSSCEHTLFSGEYRKEILLSYIDDINLMYVAMTRAQKSLTLISAFPDTLDRNKGLGFSDVLETFVSREQPMERTESGTDDSPVVTYSLGEEYDYDYDKMERKKSSAAPTSPDLDYYPLWPLNPLSEGGDSGEKKPSPRLRLRTDSSDSSRHRGNVMHGILQDVVVPEDLEGAVQDAVERGDISEEDAARALPMLRSAIGSHPEWFPEEGGVVRNEATIIGDDGKEYRPDRVVELRGVVTVIDYKFGEEEDRYRKQVGRYAENLRGMGYPKVEGYIWYVASGKTVKV